MVIEAFVVRAALRRAHLQYGAGNVRLSSQFARLLASNSILFKTFGTASLRKAFLAPINFGASELNETNAMWFLPDRKLSRAAIADGLLALNRTRRQTGLSKIHYEPRPVRAQMHAEHYKAKLARSIARYFYSKHYMRMVTMPGKTTEAHLEALLNNLDPPRKKRAYRLRRQLEDDDDEFASD